MSNIKATLKDHMGSDLTTVNAARVSFGKESDWQWAYPISDSEWDDLADSGWQPTSSTCLEWKRLSEKDAKLIKYLASGMSSKDIEKWKKQMIEANDHDTVMEAYEALSSAEPHLSPFGHAFASFHVKAPIFVARQLVKHKFLRWNEISRRYVDDEPEFYVADVWRGRSEDKKQGSSDDVVESNAGMLYYNTNALGLYKQLLDEGVAPEQARMVLPQSLFTEWYWSGSLDAFAAMCNLRCAPDTQYETRIVADQISKVMGDLFPVSWAALMENTHE